MAITRAQQVRQMLEDGGMLVQPGFGGTRQGYRGDAAYGDKDEKGQTKDTKAAGDGPASKGFDQGAKPGGQPPSVYGPGGPYQPPDDKQLREIFDLKPDQKIGETKRDYKSRKRREKKAKSISDKAFRRFQKLDEKGLVSLIDDYGEEGETLAKESGYTIGPDGSFTYDPGFFRDPDTGAFKEDFLYTSPITGATSLQIPGYEFGNIDKFGKPSLRSNVGTSIESVRPNISDLQDRGFGILDLVGKVVNPDTQVGAFNTLTDARNIQEFADRYAKGDDSALDEYEKYMADRTVQVTDDNDKSMVITDPCKGPNPPAYCFIGDKADDTMEAQRNLGGLAPRFAGSIFDFTGMADGGRIGAAEGGIMDLARQEMFLGGIAKSIKKITKKATRAVKKIAKSPIGKAAILGAIGFGIPGTQFGGLLGRASFGGAAPSIFGQTGGVSTLLGQGGKFETLGNLFKVGGEPGGKLSAMRILGAGSLALPFLMGDDDDEPEAYRGPRIDIAALRGNPYEFLAPRFTGSQFAADGGRIGYQEGSKEPVAKKTMPLLDMGGKEMDLREEGGFVPIGRMEKADDVPARLSKNEFVFTADAVRNAGEGDVDKGAEVMYNMMKNLESGGDVSEESQGLSGAKEMFQTSKRLEEVL